MKQGYACEASVCVEQNGPSEGEFTKISTGPTRRLILLQQLEQHRTYVLQKRAEEDEIRRKAAEEEKKKYEQRLNILRKELERRRMRKQQSNQADSKTMRPVLESSDAVPLLEQNTAAPSMVNPKIYEGQQCEVPTSTTAFNLKHCDTKKKENEEPPHSVKTSSTASLTQCPFGNETQAERMKLTVTPRTQFSSLVGRLHTQEGSESEPHIPPDPGPPLDLLERGAQMGLQSTAGVHELRLRLSNAQSGRRVKLEFQINLNQAGHSVDTLSPKKLPYGNLWSHAMQGSWQFTQIKHGQLKLWVNGTEEIVDKSIDQYVLPQRLLNSSKELPWIKIIEIQPGQCSTAAVADNEEDNWVVQLAGTRKMMTNAVREVQHFETWRSTTSTHQGTHFGSIFWNSRDRWRHRMFKEMDLMNVKHLIRMVSHTKGILHLASIRSVLRTKVHRKQVAGHGSPELHGGENVANVCKQISRYVSPGRSPFDSCLRALDGSKREQITLSTLCHKSTGIGSGVQAVCLCTLGSRCTCRRVFPDSGSRSVAKDGPSARNEERTIAHPEEHPEVGYQLGPG